jgi:sugar phosphate isomerase/epimerase
LTARNEQVFSTDHPWELGVFAPSVASLTPRETLALASHLGYSYVEWRLETADSLENSPWGRALNTLVLDDLTAEAENVQKAQKDAGVQTCALQLRASIADRQFLPVVMEAANILKSSRLQVEVPELDSDLGYRRQVDDFRSHLSAWVEGAVSAGVRLCVESHFGSIAPSVALALRLIEPFSPAEVGVVWDPANGLLEGSEAPPLALDLLDDHLAEVHAKNGGWWQDESGEWTFKWCGLDEGIIDWTKILGLLDAARYGGPLVVEDYRQIEPDAKLRAARDNLHRLMSRRSGERS